MREFSVTIKLIGAGLVGVVLLSLFACSGDQPAVQRQSVTMEVLQTAQKESDKLPEQLDFEQINHRTTRQLGSHGNQAYWVGYKDTGEICIIAAIEIEKSAWSAAAGCEGVVNFARRGVVEVTLKSGRYVTSAALIPDGYAQDATEKLPTAIVRDNLIAFDSAEAVETAMEKHGETVIVNASGEAKENNVEVDLADLNP